MNDTKRSLITMNRHSELVLFYQLGERHCIFGLFFAIGFQCIGNQITKDFFNEQANSSSNSFFTAACSIDINQLI